MPISNKDNADVKTQVFKLVNDFDKVKPLLEEIDMEFRDRNVANIHVFYNIETELFTMYPTFGETFFVAYLALARNYNRCLKQFVYDADIDGLHHKIHQLLIYRVKRYKNDLLKMYFVDKTSKEPPISFEVAINTHNLQHTWEIAGYALPENIRESSLYITLDRFYRTNQHTGNLLQIKVDEYSYMFNGIYSSEFFKNFKNTVKERILNDIRNDRNDYIQEILDESWLTDHTMLAIADELRKDFNIQKPFTLVPEIRF